MLYNLFEDRDFVSVFAVALLAEGVDRNKVSDLCCYYLKESPSSRRAWIEIPSMPAKEQLIFVALLAEGVDRNVEQACENHRTRVALLAEGVDRNTDFLGTLVPLAASPSSRRAWIEITPSCWAATSSGSPSSRRAWIEIFLQLDSAMYRVSPSSRRAWIEIAMLDKTLILATSPSSRRAWIEILRHYQGAQRRRVALLAEGVDRNFSHIRHWASFSRRPPRGGRG